MKPNIIMRWKSIQHLKKNNDMYSQLHRVSTHNRTYLKRINLQNELILKNNQNKKLPSTKLRSKRWIFFKLAERVDGFILKNVLFI